MTSEMLFRAIGQISDEKIAEANIIVVKPKSVKFTLAVAAVMLMLAFATAALAVSGIIDIGSIVNSIFNNKEAAPYIQKGEGITLKSGDSEITIEPIAAFFDTASDGLYIELKIIDPTGTKLSDSLLFTDSKSGFELNTGPAAVRVIDKNTVIAGLFITPVNIGETTFRFDIVASGITYYGEEQRTLFSISEHIGINNPVVVRGAEFVEITAVRLDEGLLTITHRKSDPSFYGYGFAHFGIMKPDGEVIYSSSGGETGGVPGQYDCFEIGDMNPEELTLVWTGVRYDHTMTGSWEVTVSGENVLEVREFNGEFEGHSTQVILGATSVEFLISTDYVSNPFPYDHMAEDAVSINLIDGTIVHPRFSAYMNDPMTASYSYTMDFINPDNVVSVMFCGTTISD